MSNQQDISIKLSGDTSNFTSVFKAAFEGFKQGIKGVEADSKEAKEALSNAFGTLNVKPLADLQAEAAKVREAFNTIRDSAGTSNQEVSNAATAMKAKLAELSDEMNGTSSNSNKLGSTFSELKGHILGAVAAFVSFAAIKGAFTSIIDEGSEGEQQMLKLKAAFGGTAEAGELAKVKMSELGAEANRLGQDADVLVDNYNKLALAAKGTSSEGKILETSFKALNDIQGSLGLTASQTSSITDVLAKAFSKGSVSAKELRSVLLQAGLSMEAFAQASGQSLSELESDLKEGTLSASELAAGLAKIANVDLAGQSGTFADTLAGQLNKLKNTVGELNGSLADSGVYDVFKDQIKAIIEVIAALTASGKLQEWARSAGEALGTATRALISFGTVVADNIKLIGGLVGAFAGLVVVNSIVGTVATAVRGLLAGLALLGGGLGVVAGAVVALKLALAAMVALLVVGGVYAFGQGLAALYDKFVGTSISADKSKKSIDEFNQSLKEIKPVDSAKLLGDNDAQLQARLKGIEDAFKQRNENIIDSDKVAGNAFTKVMDGRLSDTIKSTGNMLNTEKQLNTNLDNLNKQKASLDQQHRQADEIAAKQSASNKNAIEKTANDERVALQKSSDSALKAQIDRTTADIKQAAEERKAYSTSRLNEDVAVNEKRVGQLKAIEDRITENVKLAAKLRGDAIREAGLNALRIVEESTAKEVAAVKSANTENIASIKDRYAKAIEEGKGWLEKMGVQTARVTELNKQKDIEIVASNKAASDSIIEKKTSEKDRLEGLLKGYEDSFKSSMDRIKSYNDTIAEKQRAEKERQFEISVKGLAAEEEAGKRVQRITEAQAEAEKVKARMATETGEALAKSQKELNSLTEVMRKQLGDIQSLSKSDATGFLSPESMRKYASATSQAISDIEIGATKAAKTMEEGILKGYVEPIAKLKTEIGSVTEQIKGMNEALKFKPTIDPAALTKIGEDLKKAFAETAEVKIKANTADLESKFLEIKKGTESKHTVEANAKAAQAAIDALKAPTSSTHTVYINEVRTGGGGGAQMNAEGGLIRGAGTGTSDSILSYLSNGEYVIKASSVQKFGSNFFSALNNGFVPADANTPRFATGGLVGASRASSSEDNSAYVFNIAGQSIKMRGARDQANALASALTQLSRAM